MVCSSLNRVMEGMCCLVRPNFIRLCNVHESRFPLRDFDDEVLLWEREPSHTMHSFL